MARKKKAEVATAEVKAKKPRSTPKGGKSRGKRVLSNEQVLAIVAGFNAGAKMSVLARENSVTHPTVSAIIKGRTYVWLTGIGQPAAPAPVEAEVREMEAA